jgi:hypothetical protein
MRSFLYRPGIRPQTAPGTSAIEGKAPVTLRRARVATVAYFVVLGLTDGVWLARLPAIKEHLGLSDGCSGWPCSLLLSGWCSSRPSQTA